MYFVANVKLIKINHRLENQRVGLSFFFKFDVLCILLWSHSYLLTLIEMAARYLLELIQRIIYSHLPHQGLTENEI